MCSNSCEASPSNGAVWRGSIYCSCYYEHTELKWYSFVWRISCVCLERFLILIVVSIWTKRLRCVRSHIQWEAWSSIYHTSMEGKSIFLGGTRTWPIFFSYSDSFVKETISIPVFAFDIISQLLHIIFQTCRYHRPRTTFDSVDYVSVCSRSCCRNRCYNLTSIAVNTREHETF